MIYKIHICLSNLTQYEIFNMNFQENKTHPLEKINELAQDYLKLKQWKFQKTTQVIDNKFPAVIYQSEWCKTKITWDGQEESGADAISINYGRLPATTNNQYLIWNGEKCHCWHNISYILHFLDGHIPDAIAGRNYQRPRVMEQFRQSELGQRLKGCQHQPEWLLRMHASIWDHYGLRLFELFDLRRLDLWENYRQFMKSLYDIEGRSPNINPPLDHIC